MSAPALFFAWSLGAGGLGIVLPGLRRTSWVWGMIASGAAFLAAFSIPVESPMEILGQPLKIAAEWVVLGRAFVFDSGSRPALGLLFLAAFVWFGLAGRTLAGRAQGAAVWAMVGLLSASLMIRPFLFAAVFLELAALAGAVVLAWPGSRFQESSMRLLAVMTPAMLAVLLAGWFVDTAGVTSATPELARSATGLLLFGFAILLAVPPFHLWILPSADTPQVAGRISPAAPAGRISPAAPAGAIWIEMTLHLTGVMLALRFLDSYDWLRQSPELYRAIRLAGIVSTSAGAVAALAMSDPRRSAVYALVSNSGVVLLALGLAQGSGVSLAVMLCALRLPGAALTGSGGRSGEAAADGRSPPLSLGDTYGRLALAGFPLTPEFPARATLLAALAPSDPTAFLVLGGSSLLLTVVALRSVFVGRQGTLPSVGFGKTQMAGVILCISASVLPVPILTGLAAAAAGFVNLSP